MTVCSTCKHANYCEIVAGGYSSQVKSCRDYRKGEMTNEEWFCTLPTEEKATFLAIQVRLGVEFYRTDDERYQDHDWWVKWLKQPYRNE